MDPSATTKPQLSPSGTSSAGLRVGAGLAHGAVQAAQAPLGGGQLSPAQFAAQQTAKSNASYQQYMNYLQTDMGRVNYNAVNQQVSSQIGAEVNPLLAGLVSQQQAGQQAINSFTSQFANQLGSIQGNVNAAYGQAEQQQSTLDTAIAAQLRGAGTDQANQLQQTLSSAGQDTSPAAQAAQAASGAAAASYATGSASLSQLIAQGASNAAYGAKLPGYAALSGLQATQGLAAQIAQTRNQILSDAQKQIPQLQNDAINQQLSIQQNKLAGLKGAADIAASNAKNANTYVTNLQKNTITARNDAVKNAIEQQDANTRQANAKIAASKALTAEMKPTVYGGQKSGYFALVPDGKGGQTNVQLTTPGQAPPTIKTYSNGLVESIDPTTGQLTILHQANPKQVTPPNLTKVNGTQGGKLGTWLVDPKTGAKVSFTPNGKTPTKPKTTGGLTENEIGNSLNHWAQPQTKTVRVPNKNGGYDSVTRQVRPAYTFQQAISGLEAQGVGTAKAIQEVAANPTFASGMQQVLGTAAYEYARQGVPIKKALREIMSKGLFPPSAIQTYLQNAYAKAAKNRKPSGPLGVSGNTPEGAYVGPNG